MLFLTLCLPHTGAYFDSIHSNVICFLKNKIYGKYGMCFYFCFPLHEDFQIITVTSCYPPSSWDLVGLLQVQKDFLIFWLHMIILNIQLCILFINVSLISPYVIASSLLSVHLSDETNALSVQYSSPNEAFFGLLSRHKTKLKMSSELSLRKLGICLCPRRRTPNWGLILRLLICSICVFLKRSNGMCCNFVDKDL